ncbi:nucleotide-diphospho-sugar transferase [Neocallimastix californiae]|uniref:Nucleotide-diphospho-sugar transferase n=1 Tax=Neocallimastix californiae TaxID=1754190 RepID=A0A1Y2ADJ3_9FUNG|nr:nucleotide-diphospho-sugar transferase [Neocallimastix californiae]|eukprot:ORY20629.1 nucleotide-diphospho-sugar transferase [Neocallimastix californiae]
MSLLKFLFIYLIYINNLFLIKCSLPINISIIIPVYNSEHYLKRSIQSVLDQTLKEIEIICIDDGSTDNSLNILYEFKKMDNRITVIHFEENKGPSICRNTGINIANGEFVGFTDSDDYIDKRFFENLYNYSKNNDIVVGTFVRSTNDSEDFIPHKKLKKIQGYVWNSIFRRKFLDSNNLRFPTNIRFKEDEIFRIECYKHNPKLFETPDEGIYYYYKQREGTLCNYKERYLKNLSKRIYKQSKRNEKGRKRKTLNENH